MLIFNKGEFFFLLKCAPALVAGDTVYQWTDKDGNVHYSGQPPPAGTQAVEKALEPMPNVGTVDPYLDADDIRERLKKQVFSPVRWVDTTRRLIYEGTTSMVECGPGKVLTGLARRIDKTVPAVCIDSPESLLKAIGNLENDV